MGTWANDPATGIQTWRASQFLPTGGPVYAWGDWIDPYNPDAGRYAMDVAPLPVGYQIGLPSYQSINVGTDNYFQFGEWFYKQIPPTETSGTSYDFNTRYPRSWVMGQTMGGWGAIPLTVTPDYTKAGDGPDLGMLAVFASIVLAGGALSGALAPESASVASAATETTAAEAWATAATETSAGLPAATQGVTTVGETGLEWYSVDPGPDPFATTADVNAGWSYDGGYPGVDWYNNAGVGEAPSFFQSLTSSAEQAGKLVSNLGKLATSAGSAIGKTRAALAQPAPPNYTRAAGSINLGLLAVAALAWKLL